MLAFARVLAAPTLVLTLTAASPAERQQWSAQAKRVTIEAIERYEAEKAKGKEPMNADDTVGR